jgi:hypothetical protein
MPDMDYSHKWDIDYPGAPSFHEDVKWEAYGQFRANWAFSTNILNELNARLNEQFGRDNSFSVLIAGSFGRLDAHAGSDLDFMVIHRGILENGDDKIKVIRQCVNDMGIQTPNPEGAFSKPIDLGGMLKKIGSIEDNLNSTAQRLLLLMEGRPLYNPSFFKIIINNLIDHYLRSLRDEPDKEALLLLNDLIKYFRNICINVDFSFRNDKSQWGMRYIKLRHSRILIYAGLLFLILTSSKLTDKKIAFLRDNIELTPLEKIYLAYTSNNDKHFSKIVDSYNFFLNTVMNKNVRLELSGLDYSSRCGCKYYVELKSNSDRLKAELTRFILDNRVQWTPEIFEYLIF